MAFDGLGSLRTLFSILGVNAGKYASPVTCDASTYTHDGDHGQLARFRRKRRDPGQTTPCMNVLVSGLACMSMLGSDGRRRITKLSVAVDFCNLFDAHVKGATEA
ncbi:hypothetical protein [Sphingomonas sp. ZB1N12]|uniref:hypothetical protein n=1 Tax=Sphingomonas arabinosi TaxID=3096160 RepID=UPI002FCBA0A8